MSKSKSIIFSAAVAFITLLSTGVACLLFKSMEKEFYFGVIQYIVPLIFIFAVASIFGTLKYAKTSGGFGKAIVNSWPVLFIVIMNIASVTMPAIKNGKLASNWVVVLLALLVGNLFVGLFEEMVFRNVILNKLLNADPERNIKRAVIISSILFALFHLGNLTVAASRPVAISTQVIYTGLMGVFFAAVYLKTKTLLGPIIVHSFIDFTSALPELFSTASGVENPNIPDINIISALITIAVVIPCFIKGVKIIKNLPKSDVDITEA